MSHRRFVVILVIVGAAAFAGRTAYILMVTRDTTLSYDELYYKAAAVSVADGDGFRFAPIYFLRGQEHAEHPPLTSLTLAPVARLTNNNELDMRLTVALAGIGAVVLIGLIAREVAGARAGLVAAGVAAVYPNLWANDGLLLAETFATLGTAATVFCTYRLIREPRSRNAAGAGVACALAMLSRSELALLVPLLVVPAALMIKDISRAHRLRLAGVVVLTASLAAAPWVGYNLARFEKPVFLSYGGGGLLGANCDKTYSGRLIGFWDGACGIIGHTREPSVDDNRKLRRALHYIRAHLDRLPVVMVARVGRVWSLYRPFQMAEFSEDDGVPKSVSLTGWGMYWVLAGLAVAGTITLRRRRVALIPLLSPVVIVTLAAAAFYGRVRFRVPAEVSIVALAAVALDVLIVKAGIRRRPHRSGSELTTTAQSP